MSLSRESLASAILYHLSVYSEVRIPYLGILTVESDGAHLDTSTHMMRGPRRKFHLYKEDYKKRIDLLNTIHNHFDSEVSFEAIEDIFTEWKKEIEEIGHVDLGLIGSITKKSKEYFFAETADLKKFINPSLPSVKWVPKIDNPNKPEIRKTNYVHKTRRKWGLFRLVSLFILAFCITVGVFAFKSNSPKKQNTKISQTINKKNDEVAELFAPSEKNNFPSDSQSVHVAPEILESTPVNKIATKLPELENVTNNKEELEKEKPSIKLIQPGCYLITGAFAIPDNADQMSKSLSTNFDEVVVFKKGRLNMVGIPVRCNELSEVKSQLNQLKLDSWTYRK